MWRAHRCVQKESQSINIIYCENLKVFKVISIVLYMQMKKCIAVMNRNSFTAVMYQKQATKTISNKLKLLLVIFDYIIDLKSLQTIYLQIHLGIPVYQRDKKNLILTLIKINSIFCVFNMDENQQLTKYLCLVQMLKKVTMFISKKKTEAFGDQLKA